MYPWGKGGYIYYILFVPVTEIPLFFCGWYFEIFYTVFVFVFVFVRYCIVLYCIVTDKDDLDSRDCNLLILYDREEVV